jgi:hypothetical protein
MYKDLDNNWQTIEVEEGFTQGCPFSPLFAGIVLTHILQKIDKELQQRAKSRLQQNNPMDDGMGGIALLMAYVDDTNCLLPLEDVSLFLKRFEEYGVPLGAVMNTDKTRIMTSTTSTSIIPALEQQNPNLATEISNSITAYSRKNGEPYEETNGLRILGSPIGSATFQANFITNYLQTAKEDASKIIEGLDDIQTMLQVYRTCTTQKMIHLYTADVYLQESQEPTKCSPRNWHCWNSNITQEFDDMNHNFIKAISLAEDIPLHAKLLMNLDTKSGGLGITTPRTKAISTYVLNIKQSIDTAKNGVIYGPRKQRYKLPASLTSLYNNWDTSTSPTFKAYRKYAPDIARICSREECSNTTQHFTYNTSIAKCHERINNEIKWRHQNQIIATLDEDSKHNTDEIFDGKLGQALLDMDRSTEANRQPNNLFRFNLLRCLRMNIWEGKGELQCHLCNQKCDRKGDHLYQCKVVTGKYQTTMHNHMRDTWKSLCDRLGPLVQLTRTKSKKEQLGLVKPLEKTQLRPFDSHMEINRFSNDTHYRCKLQNIGFDVTICNSDTTPAPSKGMNAKPRKIEAVLQQEEKEKFQRGNGQSSAKTCTKDEITMSGEEITKHLYETKQQLIPIVVSPLGRLGPTFRKFLYDEATPENPNINKERFPYSYKMAKRATSLETPSGILNRANELWRLNHPNEFFGPTYRSKDPLTHTEQQLGKAVCFGNGQYGLNAISLMNGGPKPSLPEGSLYEYSNGNHIIITQPTATEAFVNLTNDSTQHTGTTRNVPNSQTTSDSSRT